MYRETQKDQDVSKRGRSASAVGNSPNLMDKPCVHKSRQLLCTSCRKKFLLVELIKLQNESELEN